MKRVYLDDDRVRIAMNKSIHAIEEMLKLRDEYMNFMHNNLNDNMNENDMDVFKKNLDKIMRRSFYNIDIYHSEISILLSYLKTGILSRDEIFS